MLVHTPGLWCTGAYHLITSNSGLLEPGPMTCYGTSFPARLSTLTSVIVHSRFCVQYYVICRFEWRLLQCLHQIECVDSGWETEAVPYSVKRLNRNEGATEEASK